MNPLLKDIFALAADIVALATKKDLRIGTAESCTGGLIGGAITAVSGSSTPFKGGIIAYDNAVKQKQLGVPAGMIHKYGAVSRHVARAMAEGAVAALGVDIAVSVTGIAGPGGGSEDKPVGTVWIGIARKDGKQISTKATLFNYGDIGRNKVRDQTVLDALKLLKSSL